MAEPFSKNPSKWFRKLNPHLFDRHDVDDQRTAPEPQPRALPPLEGHRQAQKQNPSRRLVRITSYRMRRQDPDNGIAKWHIDALRLAGIIEDDTEDHIKLEIEQVQVHTKAEQKTFIEIT